jgi:hypothetical protein
MVLTRQQEVGSICNRVAWLTFRERLTVMWELLTSRAY